MSSAIADFRITNVGHWIYLRLLDAEGKEVLKVQLSWISGFRLMQEAMLAVSLALQASPKRWLFPHRIHCQNCARHIPLGRAGGTDEQGNWLCIPCNYH